MICNPNCNTTPLTPFAAIGCNLEDHLISGEIPYLGFTRCDTLFTDILDTAEWTAKKASGDVVILPMGQVVLNPKAAGNTKRVGCRTITTSYTKEFSYSSPIIDTVTDAESAVWSDLDANKDNILPFFITCDGSLLIQNGWASGEVIGFETSTAIVDSNNEDGGENSNYVYTFNGTIKDRRIFKRVKLTAAQLAAIIA